MVEGTLSPEYVLARQTAEEYRRKGYEVTEEVPLDFLPGFYADLVVRKDDEVKVIEVKSRASLAATPRIRDLAKVIESQPGWSFDLLLVGEPEKLDAPEQSHAFQRESILRRIEEAEMLLGLGHSDPALVLAWSAYEAAARLAVSEQGVPNAGITRPEFVLDQAVFLGILSRAEYNHLRDVQKFRNAIVHGFSHDGFDNHLITDLTETVRSMVRVN